MRRRRKYGKQPGPPDGREAAASLQHPAAVLGTRRPRSGEAGPAAEEGEPGTVCAVLQKGYKMGDFVLRHAMVKVVAEA